MRRVAALLISLLATTAGFAASVSVDDSLSSLNVSASLEYLEDRSGALTFEAVKQGAGTPEWKASDRDYVNFGYTPTTYWFRLLLSDARRTPGRLFLEIDFSGLDRVNWYYPDGRGGYSAIRTGDDLPFKSRGIRDRSYLFPVDQAGGEQTYFLRIRNDSSFRFRAYLHTENSLLSNREWSLALLWIVYGKVFLAGFFYLFLFAFMRERAYLYFSLAVLGIFLHQMVLRGYAFQYAWPEWTGWNNAIMPFITAFCCSTSLLFIRESLDTRATNRFFHRLSGAIAFFLFPTLALLSLEVRVNVIIPVIYNAVMALGALVIAMALFYARRGNRFARYLLVGIISIMIAGTATIAAAFRGIPAVPAAEWSIELGFLVLVLSSSLGLVDRFRKTYGDLLRSERNLQEKNITLTRTNDDLRTSIDEKVALIREVHERVRSNMEVVSSLLGRDAGTAGDPVRARVLNDAAARIHSMAAIYEGKYQAGNFSLVDMASYLEGLCRHLAARYAPGAGITAPIRIISRVTPAFMPVDRAVPCGLLFGELLTNAIKHGCRGTGEPVIELRMECVEDMLTIEMADNGPGMERDLFGHDTIGTLGIQIINALSRQVDAAIDLDLGQGTRVTMRVAGCCTGVTPAGAMTESKEQSTAG